MSFKKLITVTACAAMLGTSFSVVSSLNGGENVVAHAAVNKKVSAKQFYSDINAAMVAVEKSNSSQYGVGNVNEMKGNRIAVYTGNNVYHSFPDFLGSLGGVYSTSNSGNYDAIKYLYNHFVNRFDSNTKKVLENDYNKSTLNGSGDDDNGYYNLAGDLADAIKEWGSHYEGIAPTKSHVKAVKNKVNKARAKYNHIKKNHSKKNRKAIKKAKHNLEVAQAKYNALVK
ncbi:hypothetical protein DY037_08080 [Apilactobacillus micheneri]|uniref:hypothetical protein n=1 Tax=Apilactobacillus micheneri TaxID=1899430 RepID=UPI00112A26C0|nr:hypothetical protein [Apilactobacillus micheneri]TPR47820.1 hypothetical protein DY037_08080 [Apilactobacillus micheneri]